MRNILYLNTTDQRLQVAVTAGDRTFRYAGAEPEKRHNAALLPVVDRLLSEAGIAVKELTDLVCVAGPGSFTGIRCGAAFANALKRSTGARLYAPTSLEIFGSGDRVVALDCKHDNFYAMKAVGEEKSYFETTKASLREETLPVLFLEGETLNELIRYGSALVLTGKGEVDAVRPFYLKKSSAEREANV